MIRARIWLTCAAVHDPVSPVLVKPAIIGWQAKQRQVDLTIERGLKGPELLARMKGWVTTDVARVQEVISAKAVIKVFDESELVAEFESSGDFEETVAAVEAEFGDQVSLERMN